MAVPLAWRRWRLVAAAALAAAVVVLPWTIRNTVRFGEVVPVSNNIGSALDGANCGPTYSGPNTGFWLYTDSGECFDGFAQDELAADDEAAVARRHRDQGIRYARDHAGDLPRVAAVRVLRTWGAWAPWDQTERESLEGRPLGWQRVGTVAGWALFALAAAGVVVAGRRGLRRWPLLMTVVAVTVTTALTYGNQRFRAGAEPALLVLAAIALVRPGDGEHRGPERQRDTADQEALDGGEHHGGAVDRG